MVQPEGLACPAAEHGDRHDRYVPLPRPNRAADRDLAAFSLSGRTRAERRARTDDLLHITKAPLIRER
jgi:hypothetical protein